MLAIGTELNLTVLSLIKHNVLRARLLLIPLLFLLLAHVYTSYLIIPHMHKSASIHMNEFVIMRGVTISSCDLIVRLECVYYTTRVKRPG